MFEVLLAVNEVVHVVIFADIDRQIVFLPEFFVWACRQVPEVSLGRHAMGTVEGTDHHAGVLVRVHK